MSDSTNPLGLATSLLQKVFSAAYSKFSTLLTELATTPSTPPKEPVLLDVTLLPHDTRILVLASRLEHAFLAFENNSSNNGESILLRFNNNEPLFFSSTERVSTAIKSAVNSGHIQSAIGAAGAGPEAYRLAILWAIVQVKINILSEVLDQLREKSISFKNEVWFKMRLKNGYNALHIATGFSTAQLNFVQVLMDYFSKEPELDVNKLLSDQRNRFKFTPLMYACLLKRSWAIKALLQGEKSTSREVFLRKDFMENTALLLSLIYQGHSVLADTRETIDNPNFLTMLMNGSCPIQPMDLRNLVNEENNQGIGPVELAVAVNDFASVQNLFDLGASINQEIQFKDSPSSHGSSEEVERWNTLCFASETGNVGMVKYLVSNGADVKFVSRKHKVTPLHVAAFYGQPAMLQSLILSGADVFALTIDKGREVSGLYYAALNGNVICVKFMLEGIVLKYRAAPVSEREAMLNSHIKYDLFSTSFSAIVRNQTQIVQLIVLKALELGLNCQPVLAFCTEKNCGNNQILEMLLSVVPNVDIMQVNGKNILVAAAESRNEPLFNLLLASQTRFNQALLQAPAVVEFVRDIQGTSGTTRNDPNAPATCVICFDKACATRFVPCNHIQCCKLCAQKTMRADPRCPMCRANITSVETL